MAPVKTPNTSNKIATNSNSHSHNSISSSSAGSNPANSHSTNSSSNQRKQTGTVPKAPTKSSTNTTANGPKPLLQPSGVAQMAHRRSPLNIVASIQQHHPRTQQHKNTEIVAPIRRELKDLNDYLLTTVVTTASNNNSNNNLNNNQQQQQLQQLQTTIVQQQQQHQSNTNTTATNSDFESSQENQQRFCYPVRPIPRRNQQQAQQHNNQQTQSDFLNSAQNINLNTAIGVVIPTTPGLPPTSNAATNQSLTTVQPGSNTNTNISDNSLLGPQFEQHLQLLLVQRLKQLFENSQSQPFLNLTTNLLPNMQSSSSANLANAVLNHNTNEFNQLAQRFQQTLNSNNNNNHKINLENTLQAQQKALKTSVMVHEITPNSAARDLVVNSTSLEDVPLSEASDRAQSIQSLHSNTETPTPDNTPSYEELQQRLEASNRNIQNMQEQQQQLLKLQNAAKQHLSDMEKLRQQAQTLSFPAGSQRGADGDDGSPDYQSIDQVHSDMAALVGRMKNLTTFIHNQNELSSLMGDDGPEILAEQELLQRKLEALRAQRDEMRNIVSELQTVNRSAEETAKEARQRQFEQEKDVEENEQQSSPTTAPSNKKPSNVEREREVPVEYSRNVPIELLQQTRRQQTPNTNGQIHTESDVEGEAGVEDDEEQRKIAAALIQQKVADIDAMKAQLKRLKDMMETVNIIESHTTKDPKLIGRTSPREVPIAYDRERTPVATPSRYQDDNSADEFIARKVRMLNEVTSDLRAQAQSLQSEKDRIQALKDEIERRKQQAAAAAQMGEEALKRNSLTPTPIPRNHESRWDEHVKTQNERDQLKEEYELKKKEFEMLCKRLEQEDQQPTPTRRQDIVSEADDEAEEDNNDSDYAASTKFVPTSTPTAKRTNDQTSRNVKDSLNSTGASSNAATHIAQAASSTHDGASLEAASLQSGSSRSYSIPPPMSAMGMNFPGPIPPPLPTAWNPHQYYYATGVPPPPPPPQTSFGLNQTANNAAALSNIECICNANNLGAATSSSTATSAATNAPLANNDPMLQQFIQTQQMLISSVCQCNQMLWHQQREIDSLNQTIHVLQERLFSITAGNINATSNGNDVGYGLRSESVPPPSLGGIPTTQALPNNLYVGMNRSQSEQPIPFITGQNRNSAFSNYQQQHHQHVYRHQRVAQPQGGFNFNSETQQHNTSATATSSMYATLNNAVSQPPQASSTHFNNEIPTPQSPVVGSGPAPIFMHHHNNAIHQNNANLRTQNQQQQHHHHSNISHTLNNQVPPGNRANNYWDNFRSYSRQNLLSTNSAKSNEEQQMQQQQQQETPYERATSMPHPQPQHPSYNFQQQNQNLDECSNNLNYAVNNEAASAAQNKYLRIIQRSRINQQQQQQQYQQNVYQQQRDFLQQLNWLEEHENTTNNTTSTNAGSNTADLMYHNYNIQQSNKVGPKPNWRFRNLNEEYNTPNIQNSRHSAQPLQRYQNTLTYQQQQQHQALQHFLNPQQHQQTATPPQARNQDFLLRPAVDIDIGEANYNFLNTQQQLPLDFSNPQQQNNENILLNANEDEDEEEDDDTTSEEIKRNLLVNALKNDKFTTKFYESIKEDVFRRLESMLLDKDNSNNEAAASITGQQNLLFNNISNTSLRKFNLNEQRDQILQQQHHQQLQIHLDHAATQNLNEELQIAAAVLINNETEQVLSSSNNDNDNENEKPEEDTNWRQSGMNNCNNPNETARSNTNNTNTSVNTTSVTKNVSKKRKNLRKQSVNQANTSVSNTNEAHDEEASDNLRGACSLAAQQHQKSQQETKGKENGNKNETNTSSSANSPKSAASGSTLITKQHHSTECDLIKYIINRIRNQTHTNTLINDALLVDVAKLTATVAQNAQPLAHNINLGNNASNISPKKIYAKIKKLSLPKERDEFLRWYQKYLENTLFGNQRHQISTDKGKSSTKTTNNPQEQQKDLQPPITDDGDLAEADQNCSLNNSGGSCVLTSNGHSSTYHQTFDENTAPSCALIPNKTEASNGSIEYENNENPDETHSLDAENNREFSNSKNSKHISVTANGITNSETPQLTVINIKTKDTLMGSTKEKTDLKCENPEFAEKE